MKSKSTITWLTITPMRLAMPRKAMNPNEVRMIQSAMIAPATP
jgi:hypothetical protein